MQKDNRPYYIRLLIEKIYTLWSKLFLIPQFQSVGKNLDVNKPWNIDIYGNKNEANNMVSNERGTIAMARIGMAVMEKY